MEDDDRSGKAAGGFARAEALSASERKIIARKAAEARWKAADGPKATHAGVLRIGDSELPAYVLDNGERVFSTRGIMHALGRRWRGRKYAGTELPVFLEAKNLKPFINNELAAVLVPVNFRTDRGIAAEGYRAEILPTICDIYLSAREAGLLTQAQETVAKKCEILLRAFSRVGIIALVDEVTGYQGFRPDDALQLYLSKVLRAELAAWAKKFPDEFYRNIYTLKNWPWPGMKKNRFSVVAYYTRDLVYERLGPGVLLELEKRTPKDEQGQRKNKFHQWLSDDFGNPMLAQHLHALITLQRLAIVNGYGWKKFCSSVDQVLPKRGSTLPLELGPTDDSSI